MSAESVRAPQVAATCRQPDRSRLKEGLHSTVRNPVSRRLTFALLAAATALGAAACAGSSSGSGSGSSAENITIGWGQDPDNVDPAITGAQTVRSLADNVFQTLIWETPAGQLTPDLATSWQVSPDGKTYTFNLRKGVIFQDGTPFNAAAVVANFKFITAKTTQSVDALGDLGTCLTATATGTYTVQVHCSSPYPLLSNLSSPDLGMQSPQALAKYGSDIQFHLVGTGPFEFVSYVPNQSLVLKRWSKFNWAPPALHQNGPAKAAELTFDFVPSSGSRISELESGQAQVIEGTPEAYYVRFKNSSQFKDLAVPIAGMGIFLPFDVNRFPTNDAAVRQAISYFINRPAAIETSVQDAYPQLTTPLQSGVLGYSTDLPQYTFDPAKGDQLLTADGWKKVGGVWTKDGKKLSIVLNSLADSTTVQILEAVQGQLATQGIDASIVNNAVTAWVNVNAAGDMNSAVLEFANPDPAQMLQWYVPGQYYDNWTKVNNPALTKLLEAGQSATSNSVRESDYLAAQKIIMNQAYEIPFHVNDDLLTYASSVSGIEYEGGGDDFFYQAQ
jgi:peptide/nickel transport system substrate-binding protein